MSNKNYMFCTATVRPPVCQFPETNLCCRNCVRASECRKLNESSKVKPCDKKDLEPDEICEFMI
jgi:hypothetical protein